MLLLTLLMLLLLFTMRSLKQSSPLHSLPAREGESQL